MKKNIKVVSWLLLISILVSVNVCVYATDNSNFYDAYYDAPDEVIRDEYFNAVEISDIEKQEALLRIADERLEKDLERLKSQIRPTAITGNESFSTLFLSGSFIYRYIDRLESYGYSLSLDPDPDGPIFAYDWTDDDVPNSWDIVVSKFASKPKWNNKNMDTMYKQYACHYRYGLLKSPWNLEVDATSMNPITCN